MIADENNSLTLNVPQPTSKLGLYYLHARLAVRIFVGLVVMNLASNRLSPLGGFDCHRWQMLRSKTNMTLAGCKTTALKFHLHVNQ